MTSMQSLYIKRIWENPDLLERAALWFGDKWDIPVEAYRESMQSGIDRPDGIPQWYLIMNDKQEIVAGAGIIDNDFHDRPDLRPNVCALFVEEPFRGQGIARFLLDFVRQDMARMGVERLYLVTDHTGFYEKCGWTFWGIVIGEDGLPERMYTAPTAQETG